MDAWTVISYHRAGSRVGRALPAAKINRLFIMVRNALYILWVAQASRLCRLRGCAVRPDLWRPEAAL